MALVRRYMTRSELRDQIDAYAEEAENGNRHDMAAALWNLMEEHVTDLNVGDTFFGVVDFDAWADNRFALIEVVDG